MTTWAISAAGFIASLVVAIALSRTHVLLAANYRGARIPVVLGLSVSAGAAAGVVVWLAGGPALAARTDGLVTGLSAALVAAGGFVDDVAGEGPRGLRGHLRWLAGGRMTTGLLKVLVAIAASVFTVVNAPPVGIPVRIAGIALCSASANLWNDLDVRPGRAGKWFVLAAAVALLAGVPPGVVPIIPAALGACLAVLPYDLLERAMLGDGGSNFLGFLAGVGLYWILPDRGIVAAAVATVALNVVAETVTLSRVIDSVRPLRWFDRLGRLG